MLNLCLLLYFLLNYVFVINIIIYRLENKSKLINSRLGKIKKMVIIKDIIVWYQIILYYII